MQLGAVLLNPQPYLEEAFVTKICLLKGTLL